MTTPFIIYTYGNQDIVYEILMSVSAFFGGGLVKSMVKLAGITTILMFLFNAIGVTTTNPNRPLDLLFFIKFYLVYSIFVVIGTTNDIVIMDTMTNQPKVIAKPARNSIPLGLILINSYTSQVFYAMIQGYERYFATGSSGNIDLSYTKSGMAFGSNFVATLPSASTGDSVFDQNLQNYFSNCGLPIAYSQGGTTDLLQTRDIIEFFATNYDSIQKARFVVQISSGGQSKPVSCWDAITEIKKTWNANNSSYLSYFATLAGFSDPTAINAFMKASNATASQLLNISAYGSDALKQAIAMNMAYKAIQTNATQVNNEALALAAYDAQQFQQYKAGGELSGEQAARIVPALKNFAEALLYMLYPLMVFYALLASSFSAVLKYIKFSATINAIPLVYEILNWGIHWYASNKTGALASTTGYNLLTASNMYNLNANIVAAANWLSMSTPALAYMLVSGSDMAITGLFGHATDPGKSTATSTAGEMAKGNMNMGNTNMDNSSYGNISYNNLSANKFNNAMDITTGSGQVNRRLDSGSTVSTYGDQTSNIAQQQSNLVNSAYLSDAVNQTSSRHVSNAISEKNSVAHQMQDSIKTAQNYVDKYGTSEQRGEMANIVRDINAQVKVGGKIGGQIIEKVGGFIPGIDGSVGINMKSLSQLEHKVGNTHSQDAAIALEKLGQSANSYNRSVDKVTQAQSDVAFAQSHMGGIKENLNNKAWQEATKQASGDNIIAEKLINNKHWVQKFVDDKLFENRQMMPEEFAQQSKMNEFDLQQNINNKGHVSGANHMANDSLLNEMNKQQQEFNRNEAGIYATDAPVKKCDKKGVENIKHVGKELYDDLENYNKK